MPVTVNSASLTAHLSTMKMLFWSPHALFFCLISQLVCDLLGMPGIIKQAYWIPQQLMPESIWEVPSASPFLWKKDTGCWSEFGGGRRGLCGLGGRLGGLDSFTEETDKSSGRIWFRMANLRAHVCCCLESGPWGPHALKNFPQGLFSGKKKVWLRSFIWTQRMISNVQYVHWMIET